MMNRTWSNHILCKSIDLPCILFCALVSRLCHTSGKISFHCSADLLKGSNCTAGSPRGRVIVEILLVRREISSLLIFKESHIAVCWCFLTPVCSKAFWEYVKCLQKYKNRCSGWGDAYTELPEGRVSSSLDFLPFLPDKRPWSIRTNTGLTAQVSAWKKSNNKTVPRSSDGSVDVGTDRDFPDWCRL